MEFTSEQVSYKVNTGRGIFVAIDDGGMDESIRKDSEPARCRRWMALECKPRLGVGEEGEIKILAQHVAEMLGLIAGRIERPIGLAPWIPATPILINGVFLNCRNDFCSLTRLVACWCPQLSNCYSSSASRLLPST